MDGHSVWPRPAATAGRRDQGAADAARGILATLFLSRLIATGTRGPTLEHLDRLLLDEDHRRIRAGGTAPERLAGILGRPAGEGRLRHIDIAIGFAAWFEGHSHAALGRYTPNVERFLRERQPGHR